jgi:hypothetical protein
MGKTTYLLMSKGLKTLLDSHFEEPWGKWVDCYNDVRYRLSSVESPDDSSNRIIKGR